MTQKKIMKQVENDSKDELVVTEKLQDKELEAVVGGISILRYKGALNKMITAR